MVVKGTFALGARTLKKLCLENDAKAWYQLKLIDEMFKEDELPIFHWVRDHVAKYHVLPQPETLYGKFPHLEAYPTAEPGTYHVDKLEERLYYEKLNNGNMASQQALKQESTDIEGSIAALKETLEFITQHKYRMKIGGFKADGPQLLLQAYHGVSLSEPAGVYGWPYMDDMGGMMPGDFISIIGRPAAGKTFLLLRLAMENWKKGKRVLAVSMEMPPISIMQRLAAVYAHLPIGQLKNGAFSTQSYKSFTDSLFKIKKEEGELFVVDGNLAATADDIFKLAEQLDIDLVCVDGAYLLKHPNPRLDKYTRVGENAELLKKRTTEMDIPTVASYQFARSASKDKKKGSDAATIDDIGSSDVIGQVSTVVMALFQEEGVETIEQRVIRILKGRNGEVGQFSINWNFLTMNFDQVGGDQENNQSDYI